MLPLNKNNKMCYFNKNSTSFFAIRIFWGYRYEITITIICKKKDTIRIYIELYLYKCY